MLVIELRRDEFSTSDYMDAYEGFNGQMRFQIKLPKRTQPYPESIEAFFQFPLVVEEVAEPEVFD